LCVCPVKDIGNSKKCIGYWKNKIQNPNHALKKFKMDYLLFKNNIILSKFEKYFLLRRLNIKSFTIDNIFILCILVRS